MIMGRYRSGYVRVDVSDIIDEIEDDVLLEEIGHRKLVVNSPGEALPIDLVEEAHRELLLGRLIEARIILERLLLPKWQNPKAAQLAFEKSAAGKPESR